jgi:hypothetical protein
MRHVPFPSLHRKAYHVLCCPDTRQIKGILDAKTSKKILDLARDQKVEIEEDEWVDDEEEPLNGFVNNLTTRVRH